MDKKIWGPYAWHLLHRVSIQNNKKININNKIYYFIFYTSFLYILPCNICKSHYDDILSFLNILDENKISRKYIIKWVHNTHNHVNLFLKKPKYKLINTINNYQHTDNHIIFIFLNGVFENLDDNLPIIDFDQIYNFFISLAHIYPDYKIRKLLIKLISTNDYSNINSPNSFKKWYIHNKNFWQS